MARIVVYSNAYRGDVYPFAPIATELHRRGHEVDFVCPREFHSDFAAEPFRCIHAGSDSLAPRSLATHQAFVDRWGTRLGGAMLLRLYIGELTVPFLDDLYDAIHDALDGADVLLSHPAAALVGGIAAEVRDVPWIGGDLFPMLMPTAMRSPAQFPDLSPRLNSLLWRLTRMPAEPLTFDKTFARYRATKGLEGTRRSPVDAMRSPVLNLGMASPHYVPPAADWPDSYRSPASRSGPAPTRVESARRSQRFSTGATRQSW